MNTIVWGVLGCAHINDKVVPPMRRAAGCRVKGIASRRPGQARESADRFGLDVAYDGYEALLADPEIDAVYIPLPNHLHVEWAIKSLEAGKHVLCEKPLGLDAAQARRLIEARDRTGRRIQEAFMVRTHPQWLRVRELVAQGAIGELRAVAGGFAYFNIDPKNIRNRPEVGGGGMLDIGCYPITTTRFVLGREPRRVVSLLERDPALGTDRLGTVLMDFEGVQASFFYSTQVATYQRMQFFGTKGRVEVEIPFNALDDRPMRLLVDDGSTLTGESGRWIELPVCDQYGVAAEVFALALLGAGDQAVSLEDSVANLRVIDAAFRSATSGQWEPV
ncbi:MAG TPA: Gfo/Idh/MocA family oxidoreductase [Burkholderiaceae bacterium]|nr:Gfo/Idh/MocA family oxidoreductase [Burkholderiaceae bacterium]